ncbi:MAG: hypothetical protein SGILL_009717, partial [Bacillariaceae sp.]
MYENAVKEKMGSSSETGEKEDGPASKFERYHLDDPNDHNGPENGTTVSTTNVPRPVAVPAGELVEVMKDIIDQQQDQPWLVAEEARAPTLDSRRSEVSEDHHKRESAISKRLREDLERKNRLATEWAENVGVKTKNGDKRKGPTGFSPEKYHNLMNVRQ